MKILSRVVPLILLIILLTSFLVPAQGASRTQRSSETTTPKIIQGPVVVATGDKWAVVEWTTNAAGRSSSTIYAGTDKTGLRTVDQTTEPVKMGEIASYQEQQYKHLVRLNDLEPGTTYYYQVAAGSGYKTGTSSILRLTTTKRPGRTAWGASIIDHQ